LSSPPVGKHAGSGAANFAAASRETAFSERARTLLYLARIGSLSTLSRRHPGFPYGSLMPYGIDDRGRPIFLISTMAMHTQNVQADPRASLLVTQPGTSGDPLAGARVTLIGNVAPVPEDESARTRELYLARYVNSKHWVDFEDFSFYRMEPVDVYYIGGFGSMGWVAAEEYAGAEPDPLGDSAPGIIQHMNADHASAMILLARSLAGIEAEEAVMTSIDRLGFEVQLKTAEGARSTRIVFPREVTSPKEARTAIVEMVTQARQK